MLDLSNFVVLNANVFEDLINGVSGGADSLMSALGLNIALYELMVRMPLELLNAFY
jgi:NH3-dependent NAD+ synthetase